MKKKVCFLLIFVVSLFVFSGRVEAAKELTCVYEGEFSYVTMLVQDSDGNRYFFFANVLDKEITNINFKWWSTLSELSEISVTFNYSETDVYDENTDELTDCPKWTSGFAGETTEVKYYDKSKYIFALGEHALNEVLSCNCLPYIVSGKKPNQEIIDNTNWIAKCAYSGTNGEMLYLYFDKSTYLVDNERKHVSSSEFKFTYNELYEYYQNYNSCPFVLYENYSYYSGEGKREFSVFYYIDKPSGSFNLPFPSGELGFYMNVLNTLDFKPVYSEFFEELPPEEEPIEKIDDCQKLLGDDLVDKINDVMDLIKIIVPILLIGFGIFDFTKAIFSGNEDEMVKCRKVFFRRIIAAILVFLVPIFINLMLSLANKVWTYISPDACIEQYNQ